MSVQGRFIPPSKIPTLFPTMLYEFSPPEKLFFAPNSPNPHPPPFGNRPSEIESPLSAHFQCALFNSQFSIFAPISQNFPKFPIRANTFFIRIENPAVPQMPNPAPCLPSLITHYPSLITHHSQSSQPNTIQQNHPP